MLTTADPITYQLAVVEGAVMIALGFAGLRDATLWPRMVEEMERSPALNAAIGLVAVLFGALVVLLPGGWSDPLAIVVSGIGLGSIVKGLALIAIPGAWLAMGRPLLRYSRPWGAGVMLAGAILIIAGAAGILN
ncbi:hypothetical protein ACFQ1E_03845 [Sphingomonas canadensis]|uniref:DUF2065 domain-containing protein n=1 Tax=Sphingomonas canadensis TaxID=1219257 RepID=A0ABW3H1Y0_9SPHN|nr:hypothetical protein [Sphingomonas canadensis]MCW3834624.1 hypothetical protein [Sphingomonas canadensis]